jgi:hypothetical protein
VDSGNISCGVILVCSVLGLVAYFLQQNQVAKQLRNANDNYRGALNLLKQRPTDPELRQRALALGREYSNLTRNKKGVTIYDEVALSNDINAACAAAVQVRPTAHLAAPVQSVERRLMKLKALLESNVITEEEYRERRGRILDDV